LAGSKDPAGSSYSRCFPGFLLPNVNDWLHAFALSPYRGIEHSIEKFLKIHRPAATIPEFSCSSPPEGIQSECRQSKSSVKSKPPQATPAA